MIRVPFWAVVLFGLAAWAQQEAGSITGQIVDPTGAPAPGAQIMIKNRATGATSSATSDATGIYRAPRLSPGIYTMTVVAAGFSTIERQAVEIRVNDRLRIDFELQVGALNQTVTVKGAAALLQTEDATAGQVVDNRKIVDLPLNGRIWLQLATLAPATVSYPGVVDTQGGNQQNTLMSLGGNRTSQRNFLLDGTDNALFIGGGPVAFPPVDSLQEFKVQTNNYTADTGRLGGAVVNATLRSGANAFHGTVYDFLRNREMNALNYFANPRSAKPEFTRNQFGASLGGRFIPNQLFFFLNYEGNRQRQNQIVTRQVFTEAQKAGNFTSQLGAGTGVDGLGRPVVAGQIFDPFSVRRLPSGTGIRDSFPGNLIPTSRMSAAARSLIALAPAPNASGSPNFIVDLSNPLNIDTFVGRVDVIQSQKNTIFGHFIYSDQHNVTAPVLGLPLDGGSGAINKGGQRKFALGWTHGFDPTHLNEFRLGYVRNVSVRQAPQLNEDVNRKFGIPFPYPGDGLGGLANIGISGFTSLGTTSGTFPQYLNTFEISDDYTWIHGAHNFKFGFLGLLKAFQNRNACGSNNGCRGVITFNGVYTQQPGFAGTGSPVADFLMGVMNNATYGNVRNEKDISRDIDLYAQDRWLVSKSLTLTLGVRYARNAPSWVNGDLMSNVLFGSGFTNAEVVVPPGMDPGTFTFLKDTLIPYVPVRRAPELGRGLVRSNWGTLAPRLAIAWQISPKTVVRTGYGIFYGFADVVGGQVLSLNPPGNLSVTASGNSVDPTLILDNSIFGPTPFNRALTNPNFNSARDPRMKAEVAQMYNLIVQRQLSATWMAEVGFIGNRSSSLLIVNQVNDAVPALPTDNSTPQSRRRVSTRLGNLPYLGSQGFSNYNALIVNVEKRFSEGLTLLANYTWSRALGVAPQVANPQGINTTPIVDPLNLKREYGPLEFDVVRRGVISCTYELPFGKGKRFLNGISRALDGFLGGWQVNGITTLQGGFPITPTLSYSPGKTFTNGRPNIIGDPTRTSHRPDDWLNKAAFAAPTNAEIVAGNFFGNAGRGSLREPGLVNLDFSVMKDFAIREGLRWQFRAECFNLTNTPFFGGNGAVNTLFGSPTFGRVTQAGDPRVLQLGLKLIF